jgi:hypothetical protein
MKITNKISKSENPRDLDFLRFLVELYIGHFLDLEIFFKILRTAIGRLGNGLGYSK